MAKSNGPKVIGAGDTPPLDPTVRYVMPTTEQQDYERRRTEEAIAAGEDIEPHPLSVDYTAPRSFAVEGNDTSDYVGVDPEYRTYANISEKPMRAEGDGATALAEDKLLADENFPYNEATTTKPNDAIVGTGSSSQPLLPATSGSSVNGVVVTPQESVEDANAAGKESQDADVSVEPADGPAGDPQPPTPPGA